MTQDFTTMDSSRLIDHIVGQHHVSLKNNLPKLSELVTTILRVHGRTHPELFSVHKLFHQLQIELVQHMIKEEVLLFPTLKEKAPATEYAPLLAEVNADLDEMDLILGKLGHATNDFQAPADGCGTYHLTFDKLAELVEDLVHHIHLERDLLFKRYA